MHSNNNTPNGVATVPSLYGLARALVRIWFSLTGRKIRVLRGAPIPDAGPAILALGHPPSFLAALALVAAAEHTIRCVLSLELGFWARTLARWLGMITWESADDGQKAAKQAAHDALSGGEVVVCFSEPGAASSGGRTPSGQRAARMTVDLSLPQSGQSGVAIFPVHLYVPGGGESSREVLIHLGPPLVPLDFLAAGGVKEQARGLARALDEALKQNVFRLMETELQLFLSDLEEVLIEDLEEDWATRPDWKQKTNGFKLSQFLAECVEQLNSTNPAQVVALRNKLETYKEARRRWSLGQAEVEAARSWLEPAGTRLWYWFESIVGLPIAFYGFVNHLLAWAVLKWRGLLDRKASEADSMEQWFLRGLVVVGCYAAQIAICAFVFGRATAGYYALALPFVGGYLWRYRWLARARARLLLLEARLPRRAAQLREQRQQLVAGLNESRDAYAETVGAPH